MWAREPGDEPAGRGGAVGSCNCYFLVNPVSSLLEALIILQEGQDVVARWAAPTVTS